MANLNDILARIAPPYVNDVAVTWDLDFGGHWIEVVGWFSPGVKLGEPKHEVGVRHTEPKSGDPEVDLRNAVDAVIAAARLKNAARQAQASRGPTAQDRRLNPTTIHR
jgi:hypothetical protein